MTSEWPPRYPKCGTPTDGNHCPHCGHRMIPEPCSLYGGVAVVAYTVDDVQDAIDRE